MKIVKIDPMDAKNFIEELDEYQTSLYPAQSNHLDSLDVLCTQSVIMLGALEKSTIAAIGAVKIFDDYGEMKRIYVPNVNRGKGLAKMIIAELEKTLTEKSITYAKLETGIHQHEAIGLYLKLGYHYCKPFGSYRPDPFSVFMAKKLEFKKR